MHARRKKRLIDILLEEVIGCYECQAWDAYAPVWAGPHTDIGTILDSENLSEPDWDVLLRDFQCPRCGVALNSPFDAVQVKSNVDREIERIFRRLSDKRTTNSLKRFHDFLSQFPYLGYHHSLGRRLFESIELGVRSSIYSESWYRARLAKPGGKLFQTDEMGAPDPQRVFVREGRFSHTGQAFLYLASHAETAHKEVYNGDDSLTMVQRFYIPHISDLLDIRRDYNRLDRGTDILYLGILYNGYVDRIADKSSSWKPEYFVTRYIADVARLLKFNGILYVSTVSKGHNLVLFDPHFKGVRTFEQPEVFEPTKPKTSVVQGSISD